MQKEFELELNHLDVLTKYLKEIINEDCIVILRGDLASGKTTLVKNYLKILDLPDLVTSPTFSLQAIYSNDIFHYDVYNKTLAEFISLGMLRMSISPFPGNMKCPLNIKASRSGQEE